MPKDKIDLKPKFVRAGNELINLAHVIKISPDGANAITLHLSDGTTAGANIPGQKVLEFMAASGYLVAE